MVLLKAYQNTKGNFYTYGIWPYSDVIIKTMGNLDLLEAMQMIWPNLIWKVIMRAFRKCAVLIEIEWLNQKLWPLSWILSYILVDFIITSP